MKLADASKYFDTVDTYDGYTGRLLFKSQPGGFESSNPTSSVAKRRVLSVAPDVTMPARGCIRIFGERWIVADGSVDGIYNQELRRSYWMRKALALYSIRTPGQGALGSGGTQAYGMHEYQKDTVNASTDAEYDPQYLISFVRSEGVAKGQILVAGSDLFHVRDVFVDSSGFSVATADDISGAAMTVTFVTSAYVPSTDTETTSSTAVAGLVFEPVKLFQKQTQADAEYFAGDRVVLVAKSSVTPYVGQKLTADSMSWRVETSTSYSDAWLLHIRRT